MGDTVGIQLVIYGAIALNILLILAVARTYGEVKKIRQILERREEVQQEEVQKST